MNPEERNGLRQLWFISLKVHFLLDFLAYGLHGLKLQTAGGITAAIHVTQCFAICTKDLCVGKNTYKYISAMILFLFLFLPMLLS